MLSALVPVPVVVVASTLAPEHVTGVELNVVCERHVGLPTLSHA